MSRPKALTAEQRRQRIQSATQGFASADQALDERREQERGEVLLVPLDRIQPRARDTRPLNAQHVEALAESIQVLGLLQPLVVDERSRLLAGGHRLGALRRYRETQPQSFAQQFPSGIPARVMPFDADTEPERALTVEIAENEQRRDYTPPEIRALADRLLAAGYVETRGRPRKGEKALRPALEVIVGKSLRTLRKHLNLPTPSPQKGGSPSAFLGGARQLTTAKTALEGWLRQEPQTSAQKRLAKQLPEFLELLANAINE